MPPVVLQDLPIGPQGFEPSKPQPEAAHHQPTAPVSADLSPAASVEQVEPPVLVKYVRALYPQMARAAQLEGDVVVEAAVDSNGRVTEVRVLRTAHRLLDPAAIVAVRQYEYRPGRRNSTPSTFLVQETVAFRLR
jgi:protein TonB